MDLGLRGRVAIVAAASKGLGRAVAEALALEGAELAICARTAADLQAAASQIQAEAGREVFWQALDVGKAAEVSNFVADVEKRFGRVDICVTNTGGPPSKLFSATTVEDWRVWTDQLLMSTVYFAQETLPRMQKNKWGRFLTITSYSVKQPVEGLLLSNSLRAGVTGLVRTLANEYGAHGITVNNVCPGYTRTDRLDDLARGGDGAGRDRGRGSGVCRMEEADSRGAPGYSGRIRVGGDFPCFRKSGLRERSLAGHRRRHDEEPALEPHAARKSHTDTFCDGGAVRDREISLRRGNPCLGCALSVFLCNAHAGGAFRCDG